MFKNGSVKAGTVNIYTFNKYSLDRLEIQLNKLFSKTILTLRKKNNQNLKSAIEKN
jgi:hypothetical protein